MFTCDNLGVNSAGHLTFAGQDTAALAKQYGTPLYLMDEARLRHNCRVYLTAMRRCFGEGSRPLFAGKANCFTQMYRILSEEGMGIDVVSCGEIHTAARAGYDLANAYFHGNCKTDADIAYAMERGVGYFVADSAEELAAIDAEAARHGVLQKVLLRLTPGIDTHTYEAVNTGKVDSKFGAAIETGQAAELTALALTKQHIDLAGFHCHVGSQVFAEDVFERAAVILLEFIADMRKAHGYTARQLDLGGGYGVRYVEDDPVLDISAKIESVAAAVKETCGRLGIEQPAILLEPGRSIVADAGLTLYTVGAVKRIPGYKNYVAIDGGMGDNPRFALYKSRYTVLPADRMEAARPFLCSVVGRCCE
ncbi:MAG: diaminopimelate decarboxylase, partial [Oscillospiraceae bacterium]|nr:diaminopimelate decarboxylase [Oscillospiraceae bacterium]